MLIHAISGLLILIGTFVSGLMAIAKKGWILDMSNPHNLLGVLIVVLVGVIVASGMISKLKMHRSKWSSKLIHHLKAIHKVIFYDIINN